jgi:tRNA-splicing ligase RtcB
MPNERFHTDKGAKVGRWLASPLPDDVKRALARLERAEDVRRIAVMPDVHLGTGVCVGTVVATERLVYPQAVGGDIGCGMSAVALDCGAEVLRAEREAMGLLDALRDAVPILRHRRGSGGALPEGLDVSDLSDRTLVNAAHHDGSIELGTLGRGNHFVEFQADAEDRLWLMVHSGSRAVGQAIARFHLTKATRAGGGLSFLDSGEDSGLAYLRDAAWAARFARANREAMIEAVTECAGRVIGVAVVPGARIECDHNHVRVEEHSGLRLLVHRKGANSAALGEPGVIPGSMGSRTYHVEGRGCEDALRSSSHGAGRVGSRADARKRVTRQQLLNELGGVWFDERLAGGLVEEAPSAYKDIEEVMRAQRELVKTVRVLRPVLSYKGV